LFGAFYSALSAISAVDDHLLCGFLFSFQVKIVVALAAGACTLPLLGHQIFA
jgi:hypothetical protein